jgi:hypothetical protein
LNSLRDGCDAFGVSQGVNKAFEFKTTIAFVVNVEEMEFAVTKLQKWWAAQNSRKTSGS